MPVVLASCHGLVDAYAPPFRALLAYAPALVLPFPEAAVFPSFLVASCVHFARDVPPLASVAAHALLLLLSVSPANAPYPAVRLAAWGAFALFYVGVHARRVWQEWYASRPLHAACAGVVFVVASALVARLPAEEIVLHPLLQRTIVGHVVLDETTTLLPPPSPAVRGESDEELPISVGEGEGRRDAETLRRWRERESERERTKGVPCRRRRRRPWTSGRGTSFFLGDWGGRRGSRLPPRRTGRNGTSFPSTPTSPSSP